MTNQKGGVGKSTTAILTGCAAVELGARVLIRDMDPQCNVTASLEPTDVQYTMNDVLRPAEETGEVVESCLGSAIRPAGQQWPSGLYVVPSHLGLVERESDQTIGREFRLRTVSRDALDAFDLVIDDCPPSIGQLTVNALVDDDCVLIVTKPEHWAVQGTHQARRTIKRVVQYYNPELEFLGVLITEYRETRVEARARFQELEASYPKQLWDVVPDIEVIRKSVGANSPLTAYGAEGAGARDRYTAIADRLLNH